MIVNGLNITITYYHKFMLLDSNYPLIHSNDNLCRFQKYMSHSLQNRTDIPNMSWKLIVQIHSNDFFQRLFCVFKCLNIWLILGTLMRFLFWVNLYIWSKTWGENYFPFDWISMRNIYMNNFFAWNANFNKVLAIKILFFKVNWTNHILKADWTQVFWCVRSLIKS